jgi:WD40 repeat protein
MTSHIGQVNALVQINQNQVATAGNDMTIKIWDITTKSLINTYCAHLDIIKSLVILPDGKLASGAMDKAIRVWDMQTKTVTTVNIAGYVSAMIVNPTGILIVLMNNTLAFYDSTTLNLLQTVSIDKSFNCIEILLPSGNISLGGASLDIYSSSSGLVKTQSTDFTISKLKQLPDNLTLVCGLTNGDLILFNCNTNSFGSKFIVHTGAVNMLSMTPDFLYLVSGGADGSVVLWYWRFSTMMLVQVKTFSGLGQVYSGSIIAFNYIGNYIGLFFDYSK